MTTTVLKATTTWQEAAVGVCLITAAKRSLNADPETQVPLNSTPYDEDVLVHIGSVAPAAGSFAYHEFSGVFTYTGTEKVYVRTVSGTRVLKVTTVA